MGRYTSAAMSEAFDERADPKVQLEQAMAEAQAQHRRLREQAATVIANQKHTEIRLNRAMEELSEVSDSARHALRIGDERAALAYAARMVTIEADVEGLKAFHLHASGAAEQAKRAVDENAVALQKTLGERQKLLSQLDQARMQEQINGAMAMLSETVGHDVPTLGEVRDKIERRYARALGVAELQGRLPAQSPIDFEQSQLERRAAERLDRLRLTP